MRYEGDSSQPEKDKRTREEKAETDAKCRPDRREIRYVSHDHFEVGFGKVKLP